MLNLTNLPRLATTPITSTPKKSAVSPDPAVKGNLSHVAGKAPTETLSLSSTGFFAPVNTSSGQAAIFVKAEADAPKEPTKSQETGPILLETDTLLGEHSASIDGFLARLAGVAVESSAGTLSRRLGEFHSFVKADDAASIRAKTPSMGKEMRAYAGITAEQLKNELPMSQDVAQVVDRELQKIADKTSAHFGPGGFQVDNDPATSKAAIGQHIGYVTGELNRHQNVGKTAANGALNDYFGEGEKAGNVDTLLEGLRLPPKDTDQGKTFLENQGWMFNGGLGEDGQWSFWGFGNADQALNRPGLYAGEASLAVATAVAGGGEGGEDLLASTLSKDPAHWNASEQLIGNFGARAAQLGWMSSKLGQGVVEAHNPKKEAKAPGRWAPGNNLITDFNTLRERNAGEIVKDLDQIQSFAVGKGILTPEGAPAS